VLRSRQQADFKENQRNPYYFQKRLEETDSDQKNEFSFGGREKSSWVILCLNQFQNLASAEPEQESPSSAYKQIH